MHKRDNKQSLNWAPATFWSIKNRKKKLFITFFFVYYKMSSPFDSMSVSHSFNDISAGGPNCLQLWLLAPKLITVRNKLGSYGAIGAMYLFTIINVKMPEWGTNWSAETEKQRWRVNLLAFVGAPTFKKK
jgi:hypothetical protein